MQLRTLGRFELTTTGPDGQPVRVMGAQKPLALVTYLALARDHRASRDLVQELLWGDAGQERGRKTLRQTIWSIRHRLGDTALRSEGDDLILDLPLQVDCLAFEAAVQQGDLVRAWAGYPGHFIPAFATPGGAGFEQWADLQRDHFRALWVTVGEELIRHHRAAQNTREAVGIAIRLRDELPDRADLWRVLLETLLAGGQRMQALVEAEILEGRFRTEGRPPDTATRALLERIRALPAEPPPGQPERPEADLVGREQVFASLLTAWQTAAGGAGRVVVLRGAAGIGKTRMLRDCRDRLVGMGVRTALVRARPADRDLPFGLVAALAESLVRLPGAMGVSPGAAAALVDLSPALSSLFTRTERLPSDPDEVLRLRVLALAELLQAVSEESPTAIFVDDLHWSDEASRRVITSLSARVAEQPVLLLVTLRPIRGGWPLPHGVDLVELQPLTLLQMEDLVASMAAAEPDLLAELARKIYTVSAGVPLLALAAVELALERRLLRIEEDRWICPNPDRLRQDLVRGGVLEQLLRELPAGGLDVLVALAVAGRALPDDLLAPVTGHPGGSALLMALEQRGLVVRLGDSWDIAHDRLAEAALAIAPLEVQRTTSRRVAGSLLEQPEPSSRDLRLAGRLLVGADDPDAVGCFRAWLAASRRPLLWRDVMGAAAEFLGPDATVDQVRRLARSVPLSWRLVRGHPRAAAALALVALSVGGVAAIRAATGYLEPPARRLAVLEPASDRGFLWDTSAATFVDTLAPRRNRLPITVEFRSADGEPTRNGPPRVQVALKGAPGLSLAGTLEQPVRLGRAVFPDLMVQGTGPFTLEFRAGTLPPVRTSVLRSAGGYAYSEPGQVVILGGLLNGQPVDSVRRSVVVSPGEELAGRLRLRALTTFRDAAILMGAVVLWGDRRTNWMVLTALPSHALTELELPLEDRLSGMRFRAPPVPGRYRVVFLIDAETEMRFIASRTNWLLLEPRWFDGDDVADLTQAALATLDSIGLVPWPRLLRPEDGGTVASRVTGTTLEIVVRRP